MQYRRVARIVLVMALVGCTSLPSRIERPDPTPKRIAEIHDLLVVAAVKINGGTGVPFHEQEGATYFLTAQHVVGMEPVNYFAFYDADEHVFREGIGFTIVSDVSLDLAVVACPMDGFELVSLLSDDAYLSDFTVGDLVMAAGWPGAKPAITSVGSVRSPLYFEGARGPFLFHSASGWFGFSGGPVVDVRTGALVGITIEIRGAVGVWDSSQMIAVPIPIVRKFLRERFPLYGR